VAARLLTQRIAKSAALVPGLLQVSRPGLTVLLYHRVGAGERNIDLGAEAFDLQLAYLARHARVVPFGDGLRRALDPALDEDLVALSFDDGTDDFHAVVLPILVKYGLPAIHYIATAPVDERCPYPSWAGTSDAQAMSWSQVNECVSTGLVSIGSHTHTHADLDRIPSEQMDDELRRSRELIEHHTGRACPDFAYPHAMTSPPAEAAVRRHYATAAVGGWRKNPRGRTDPYRVRRVPVTRADGPVYFRAKVRGRMAAEAALYRIGGRRG
jgi:peptidoglycan/xylan/chitin deacetylase (PgdA/CDA1 family)